MESLKSIQNNDPVNTEIKNSLLEFSGPIDNSHFKSHFSTLGLTTEINQEKLTEKLC